MREVTIFGAGEYGKFAFYSRKYKVNGFIDNSIEKQKEGYMGLPVYSFDEYKKKYGRKGHIVIATRYVIEIERQLKADGYENFSYFFPEDEVPYWEMLNEDPRLYISADGDKTVEEVRKIRKDEIDKYEAYYDFCCDHIDRNMKMPHDIEIETYNRCNGICEFCPVNSARDPRIEAKMTDELFYKIIEELSECEYDRCISLFCNNEPFLDSRIIHFHRYARKKLPKAYFSLYTNASLMPLKKFLEIIPYIDFMNIDNYNMHLELNPNPKAIYEYCLEHSDLLRKIAIFVRSPKEIRSNRGVPLLIEEKCKGLI